MYDQGVFDFEKHVTSSSETLPAIADRYFWRIKEARIYGYLRVELRIKRWCGSRRITFGLADVLMKDAREIRVEVADAARWALHRPEVKRLGPDAVALIGDHGA